MEFIVPVFFIFKNYSFNKKLEESKKNAIQGKGDSIFRSSSTELTLTTWVNFASVENFCFKAHVYIVEFRWNRV